MTQYKLKENKDHYVKYNRQIICEVYAYMLCY